MLVDAVNTLELVRKLSTGYPPSASICCASNEDISFFIFDGTSSLSTLSIASRTCRDWGETKRVAADGTQWDLYENNLLSERHIRYGGYGGIAYYHVSDTYIALFSHFIPCGAWEAIYILDGLTKNNSDIQPDILHGDTQAQSAPVYGLAFLLGIKLMPRVRNWKDLRWFKATPDEIYQHIETLFSKEAIDWALISCHLPDMLQVAQSIRAGRISPSTILRKLGTASRKNKLYFAFRELGRTIRTLFLLEYIGDDELRRVIQAAQNKCEGFNQFTQWVHFGADKITENVRDEQLKVIKYNHLVANLVIFHNCQTLTQVLKELEAEGMVLTPELLAAFSPYRTHHINRFGLSEVKERHLPFFRLLFVNATEPFLEGSGVEPYFAWVWEF